MRRVKIEIEKMKLFDWPEDAVRQYASEHIKAEKEKRYDNVSCIFLEPPRLIAKPRFLAVAFPFALRLLPAPCRQASGNDIK